MTYMFVYPAIAVFIFMSIVFLIAWRIKDNSIADIAWGLCFIVAMLASFIDHKYFYSRQIIVLALIIIWGLRLAFHIGIRKSKKVGEDWRYKKMREGWENSGKNVVLNSFFKIFILQGFLSLLIVYPALTITLGGGGELIYDLRTFNFTHVDEIPNPLGIMDLIGISVWLVGFLFESVGDYQLMKFKQNPENKGRIMTTGVWKYTRHPNYFGEVTLWWGIFIIFLSNGFDIFSLVSPILITFLILGVSGIPMLEKKYEGNKEFEEYKKRTSAFFPAPAGRPWFPEK